MYECFFEIIHSVTAQRQKFFTDAANFSLEAGSFAKVASGGIFVLHLSAAFCLVEARAERNPAFTMILRSRRRG